MKASDHWPATKGLSVYNALSVSGRDMTPQEIAAFLQDVDDPDMDVAYVTVGIEFLLARSFVKRVGSLVVIPIRRGSSRIGRPLVRANRDADLMYGRA